MGLDGYGGGKGRTGSVVRTAVGMVVTEEMVGEGSNK